MEINKILLVDDEGDIRTVGRLAMEALAKWTVIEAATGEEALVQAARERPDLILLDVNMPGIDGPTTFSRLRANPETESIPIVFMTASVRSQELAHYRALGAEGVIGKPFDPMTLADEIRALFRP